MRRFTFDPAAGATYEHTYSGWLAFLKEIAESKVPCEVEGAPRVWTPLLRYFGANATHAIRCFESDDWWSEAQIESGWAMASRQGNVRGFVEHVCSTRPELVDALWRADRVWGAALPYASWRRRDFIVASVNAFDCPEIRDYERALDIFVPKRRKAVITNCAADKPYPAPLHRAIESLLPDGSWHLIAATGVVGLLPQELWADAPNYDSGWPNFERARAVAMRYFARHRYERVVVYTDLYAPVIAEVLTALRVPAVYPLELRWRSGYLPLSDSVCLDRLREALRLSIPEVTP
jgi:hypothetical protein